MRDLMNQTIEPHAEAGREPPPKSLGGARGGSLSRYVATALTGLALTSGSVALAQTSAQPPLVSAYLKQIAASCGSSGSLSGMNADRADLNGDGLDDWVVDAGRYKCATRSPGQSAGDQVTVFVSLKDGRTIPAFQRTAFGARLERVSGVTSLWLTVAGTECASTDATARCDRRLVWRPEGFRFELQPLAAKTTAGG